MFLPRRDSICNGGQLPPTRTGGQRGSPAGPSLQLQEGGGGSSREGRPLPKTSSKDTAGTVRQLWQSSLGSLSRPGLAAGPFQIPSADGPREAALGPLGQCGGRPNKAFRALAGASPSLGKRGGIAAQGKQTLALGAIWPFLGSDWTGSPSNSTTGVTLGRGVKPQTPGRLLWGGPSSTPSWRGEAQSDSGEAEEGCEESYACLPAGGCHTGTRLGHSHNTFHPTEVTLFNYPPPTLQACNIPTWPAPQKSNQYPSE